MYVKTQRFLIIGASKSGFAVAKYIKNLQGYCCVLEELKTEKAKCAIDRLKEIDVDCINKEVADEKLDSFDVIVLSPGVPINHDIAVKAKKLGKRIIGEMEFAFLQFFPPIIAVTGTNGKTTTVTLINEILKEANIDSKLVGNVGIPFTEKLFEIEKDSVCVAEVSSFQLESVNAFCPHVSCVLNISPDHLERHYTMDNYIFLKKRIFKNQRESEFLVLNFDDDIVKGFFTETKAKVFWVSLKEKVDGAYRENGRLYFNNEFIVDEKDLRLKGEHNIYDVLFAILCAKLLLVPNEIIRNALINFKGIKHRLQLVRVKDNVEYFNDSKATNTASTISAIKSLQKPTILILGGSEKGEEYTLLFETIKISPIKHVVLTGASRYNMLDVASRIGVQNVTVTGNFDTAVKIANLFAESGDLVLLSPACASFDAFRNFEERGDEFIKVVEGL